MESNEEADRAVFRQEWERRVGLVVSAPNAITRKERLRRLEAIKVDGGAQLILRSVDDQALSSPENAVAMP
ncbi:hypothetical protein RZS08_63350, partial [Arthrospira platensis SPKY1]|nr:hypothetical protein [Arthrospira platensis SPKY1]